VSARTLANAFASAEEFLAHPLEVAPGCLTLDVSLPGLSGLELQKRAAVECPHITTIFLAAKDDIPTTVEAMKARAVSSLQSLSGTTVSLVMHW
jgi:FixJ family two-component response regulator